MVEYSNEQAQYNVDEQKHKNAEIHLAEYLENGQWCINFIAGLIKIISIDDTVQAHCCN